MSDFAGPFGALGANVTIVGVTNATSASTPLPGSGGDTCSVLNLTGVPITVVFSQGGSAVAAGTESVVPASALRNLAMPEQTTAVAIWCIGTAAGNAILQRGSGGT